MFFKAHSNGTATRYTERGWSVLHLKCYAWAGVLLCSELFLTFGASAQGRGVPLPDFQQGAKAGVIVGREHASMYRDFLPEPLVDAVASGEFSFEAALRPHTDTIFPRWYGDSSVQPTLTGEGGVVLAPGGALPQVFEIPSGALPTASAAPDEVVAVARRVLWNANAWMWSKRSLAQRLLVSIFSEPKSRPKQVEFDWERIYPQILGEVPGTLSPLFREKVSARVPKILDGLAYLTLRFLGTEEDRLWIASPITQRVRQVTGSNRSDTIFRGGFSLDELMVWSGKVEVLEPKIVTRREFLVPVIDLPPVPVNPMTNGCSKVSFEGGGQLVTNGQSRRFASAASWVPTNVLFVKRSLYRVEVATKDPFSLDARQVLYVDAETFLPIYRVSWDAQGRARRFSMGIVRAVSQPGVGAAPVIQGNVVFDLGGQGRTLVASRQLELCSSYVPGRELKNFDPIALIAAVPKGKPQEGKESRVKQSDVTSPTSQSETQGERDEQTGLD